MLSINERVEKIKNDENEINLFVEEYKPFIASCAEKAVGRYLRYGEDDELSIGLMAFVEAIKSFNSQKGNFLSLAQNIIKRRLIDFYRKEQRDNKVFLNRSFIDEEECIDPTIKESLIKHSEELVNQCRKLELIELKKELNDYKISFIDLIESSPKQENTRKTYSNIVKFILSDKSLVTQIKQKKYLPIAEIEKNLKIPRKTIERARKYIIAVVIVVTGEYSYIKDYVPWW